MGGPPPTWYLVTQGEEGGKCWCLKLNWMGGCKMKYDFSLILITICFQISHFTEEKDACYIKFPNLSEKVLPDHHSSFSTLSAVSTSIQCVSLADVWSTFSVGRHFPNIVWYWSYLVKGAFHIKRLCTTTVYQVKDLNFLVGLNFTCSSGNLSFYRKIRLSSREM